MERAEEKPAGDGYYMITSVHKDDLRELFEDDAKALRIIDRMDDGDMSWLARKLADDYVPQLFWDSLRMIFEGKYLENEDEVKNNETNEKE